MISSDEYRAAGDDGDNAGEASDGSCGGAVGEGCCARAIVAAKQTTTIAAIARQKARTGVEDFHAAHLRNYPGKLGVVEEGAIADLLLVEGNPLENIKLVADPDSGYHLAIGETEHLVFAIRQVFAQSNCRRVDVRWNRTLCRKARARAVGQQSPCFPIICARVTTASMVNAEATPPKVDDARCRPRSTRQLDGAAKQNTKKKKAGAALDPTHHQRGCHPALMVESGSPSPRDKDRERQLIFPIRSSAALSERGRAPPLSVLRNLRSLAMTR